MVMDTSARKMNYFQLETHFRGLTSAAQALGLNRQTVHAWKARKRIPSRWQLKAAVLSGGKLKADRKAQRDARELASYVQGNGG